jgi:hypothetical protein
MLHPLVEGDGTSLELLESNISVIQRLLVVYGRTGKTFFVDIVFGCSG